MSNPQVFVNPKSGSIRVSGSVEIVDADGNVTKIVENPKFCGCGHSKDKPFCDSAHKIFTVPVQQLENAAKSVVAMDPFAPSTEVAKEIREKIVEHKGAAGEKVVGLKVGGALESVENPNGILIYGYLTDVMQVNGDFPTDKFIYPRAEGEVVFKLSKDIAGIIDPSNVLDYVSHVAAGMEIFDYRFGQAQIYSNDAIADNAGAAAFALGPWIDANEHIFENLTVNVLENDQVKESAPLTAIRGNPWLAIVELSKALARDGVLIEAGSIIFSGSATKGLPLLSGNSYSVDIEDLGRVEIVAK